ncbi:hypothetical protein Tco_0271794 [Tanacetum coccineum]
MMMISSTSEETEPYVPPTTMQMGTQPPAAGVIAFPPDVEEGEKMARRHKQTQSKEEYIFRNFELGWRHSMEGYNPQSKQDSFYWGGKKKQRNKDDDVVIVVSKVKERPRPSVQESDMYRDGFLRVLFWKFNNLRMFMGSDLLIFSNDKYVAVSLHLWDVSRQVTPLTWLEAWLDNMMASLPELAICLSENGTPFFNPEIVREHGHSVLRFLQENCKQDPGAYWSPHNMARCPMFLKKCLDQPDQLVVCAFTYEQFARLLLDYDEDLDLTSEVLPLDSEDIVIDAEENDCQSDRASSGSSSSRTTRSFSYRKKHSEKTVSKSLLQNDAKENEVAISSFKETESDSTETKTNNGGIFKYLDNYEHKDADHSLTTALDFYREAVNCLEGDPSNSVERHSLYKKKRWVRPKEAGRKRN